MNILFLTPDKTDPTSFYRAGGIAHDLETKSGHRIIVLNWHDIVINWQVLSDFDIIMMQRPYTKVALDCFMYAKEMHKPIWVDYDDNLFCLNPENGAFPTYSKPDTQEIVKTILKAADVVTVPTEYLKQEYSIYSQSIEVIPNAFNDGILKRGDLLPRKKTALWRGPASHIYDMMSYGKEMNRVSEEFPEWEFTFMGFYPWFLSETKNKSNVDGIEIILYHKMLVELAPAIFHVLLHDNTFNRCRSNIAWIEGSYAGAACVVPAWWNVPGALSYTDAPSYYEAMRSLLAGEVDIKVMNMEAWAYIMDALRLSKINVLRLNVINELT
jgi:hypothetical protein